MKRLQLATVLGRPIDIASIVCFRVAFGALLVWEVVRYFQHGWIHRYYIEPSFHFTYHGFGWIRPWAGDGMEWHFAALGVLALCVAVAAFYRVAAILFFFGFTYVFLLDQTHYLNHFYLICLVALILAVVPAHRGLSIDTWRRPALRSSTVPAWSLYLLRFQIGIAYFFAGVAKLNADWLRGEPLGMWLAGRTGFPWIGSWFDDPWVALAASWASVLLDLLIVPALLWGRTRIAAFVIVVAFHLMNATLFQIGIFPWFMIAATTLFFSPSWPRRWLARLGFAGVSIVPRTGRGVVPSRAWVFILSLYALVQVSMPLRHYFIPSKVHWTDEGHRFAWHMKLRDKRAEAAFFAADPATGRRWRIDPRDYVTSRQALKMATRPDMMVQFARHVADDPRRRGKGEVQVRARVHASLNGRPPQPLVDPTVDLAAQERLMGAAPWVLPLKAPLRPSKESTTSVK